MKTVYFVRHAKSSWDDLRLPDHERPLNKRGKRDAPIMAGYLKGAGVTLDAIWTSTAERAKTTAQIFSEVLLDNKDHFLVESDLYHAPPRILLGVLQSTISDMETVAVFAHNPGMTQLANFFCPNAIDNVPTCGVFKVVFDAGKWTDVALDGSNGKWVQWWTPKSIL